ncbi:hypothetical protein LCGC14_0543520 [marine sediment metagenome]|uniref:Uncharacterized protein n=1 Tax=marine sediment metagenome TaxID=412755 RepID=A0A0F9V075_9ZZZZ
MKKLKKQVIFDLALSWIIFMVIIATIVIEANVEYPWTRTTNALWIGGMIVLAFYIGRGVYRLTKYLQKGGDE